MIIDIFGYSDIGTGFENQDNWAFGPLGENGFYAMIADGLGGHIGGKQASQIAIQTILSCFTNSESKLPTKEQLAQWLLNANDNVLRQQSSDNQMKTTIICLFVSDDQAIWAHIGDSRLYYYIDGDLSDHTNDHGARRLSVRAEKKCRGQTLGHRDKNKSVRVIGDKKCTPEVHEPVSLDTGNHSFFLCTDGLWERLIEDEIMFDLHKSETAEQWIRYLRKRAEKRQHQQVDNNTAIAVMLHSEQ